ncbi:ATP synthase E chain-domain-containing protein [Chytriomyces cf. hyalinus JEL632]|nr:ATP synthase E chain-domain-containing protein [Chytriomyces cf. hyalinus JEL632]
MAALNVASVNVARWSALAFGVFYGYSRQRSLTLHVKEQNEENEFRAYADLVEEAKVAFEAAYNREQAVKAAPYGIVIDSESYKFNGDKWLDFAVSQTK